MYDPEAVARICDAISGDSPDDPAALARAELPFEPFERTRRSIAKPKQVSVFLRDGFVDQYSGMKLVFPGTLRLLSHLLPTAIPFHPHWKTAECHGLYWDLQATVDHVLPVALGGSNEMNNLVSTSMNNNLAKGHRKLENLRWKRQQPGTLLEWDGLLSWFMKYITDKDESNVLEQQFIKDWHSAAQQALKNYEPQEDLPSSLRPSFRT